MGLHDHPVARRCADFLRATVRDDGSWPIDTDLATWVTTLSVGALAAAGRLDALDGPAREGIRRWLLGQQHVVRHPYTQADPGGWAWTDLSGGVPDADDTAGALLAIRHLGPIDDKARQAARRGVAWLMRLRNRDYGIPTFCRGWGRLPFDRSSCDLTAHALRAWSAWAGELGGMLDSAADFGVVLGAGYLARSRRPDGGWQPLWFGNQRAPRQSNAVYGTSRVLLAMAGLVGSGRPDMVDLLRDACTWLCEARGETGWGGEAGVEPSIEETAAAVEALAAAWAVLDANDPLGPRILEAVRAGCRWLLEATGGGRRFEPTPIGLYFASLWYSERLYPLVMAIAAWGRARNLPLDVAV